MSGRPEMSTTLQDPNIEPASSAPASIALIGPNATHRRVMAQALGNSDARAVREFIDYPANLGDIPHLIEEGFDVVMIDVDSDQSYALQIIESIAGHNSTIVMAYSMRNDADLIRDCMRAGARDFLPLPEDAAAEPEIEAQPEPLPEPELVPEPIAAAEPLAPPAPIPVAEPKLNPADFLRSPQAVVEEEGAEAPLNPADFLLPSARQGAASNSATSVPPPQDYAVPSRPQFVDPRRSAPPLPQPVLQPTPQPAPQPKPAPVEVRRPDPAPAQNVLPEELRRSTPPPAKPQEPAKPAEAKTADDIDTWDSLWIHPALAAATGKPIEKGTTAVPEAPAKKKPAAPSGPQLVHRAATPHAEPEPSPAPAAAAAPMFRQVEPEPVVEGQRPWVRWAIFAGVPLAIIGLALMIFLPARKSSIPATPAAESQPASTQAQSAPSAPVVPTPAESKSIAKPSAATPIGDDAAQTPAPVSSQLMNAQLNAPTRISGSLKKSDQQGDEPSGFTAGMDSNNALPGQVFGGSHDVKVVPAVSAISAGVAEGMILHKTAPVYPEIAKQAHVSGTVTLGANITKGGALTNLHVLSGPAMLRAPALEAVKTWRYRPYLLNNQPVEVGTTIRVVFTLDAR